MSNMFGYLSRLTEAAQEAGLLTIIKAPFVYILRVPRYVANPLTPFETWLKLPKQAGLLKLQP